MLVCTHETNNGTRGFKISSYRLDDKSYLIPKGFVRFFIPFTKLEARNAKPGRRGHVQLVRSTNLTRISELHLVA